MSGAAPGESHFVLTPTTRGILWMLLSTLLLAVMHAMVRQVSAGMHPFEVAFFRNLFGLAAVLPLIVRTGIGNLVSHQPRLQVVRGAFGLAAMLTWFYGLSIVPIATATALSFSAAIFASLGAVVVLGERMHLRRWSAVALGLTGVVLILRPGTEGFDAAALLIVASAVLWGTNVVIVKRLSSTDSTVSIVAWMSITLTVLSLPAALLVWTPPDMTQLLWLAAIGAAGTGGHLTMVRALKLADATAVMSVDFSRLLWATLIGYLAFADALDPMTWIGGTIIFASGIYIIYRESAVSRSRAPS